MHQIDESQLEKFSFWVPATLEKGSKGGVAEMRIKGIASSLAEDTDGQTLDPAGFDFRPLLERGFLNWDHQAKQRASAIIGECDFAELRNNNRDFYIEGFLYPDSDDAKDVYKLAQILEKNSKTRRLGFSIEGVVVEKDPVNPNWIKRARIIHIAITPMPKNPNTLMQVMKGEAATPFMVCEYDCDITKAFEEVELAKGGPGSGRHSESVHNNSEEELVKVKQEIEEFTKQIAGKKFNQVSIANNNKVLRQLFEKKQLLEKTIAASTVEKAMSVEVAQEQGTIPEHIAGATNPNKIPLEGGKGSYCKCKSTDKKTGICNECGLPVVGKVIKKSEIYNLIAENYTTDPVVANEIFSLIKSTNLKLFNMSTPVMPEAVKKAFEFLEKATESIELSKGMEADSKSDDNEDDDADDLEKAVTMCKGFDPTMSKEDMKEELKKGGFSEATADSAATIVADANANKDGGKVAEVSAPLVKGENEQPISLGSPAVTAEPAALLQVAEPFDTEGLIKSITTTLIGHSDRKFQSLGVLLQHQTQENALLKSQLDELNQKVENAFKAPQTRKSITSTPIERFAKGESVAELSNGTDLYDLNKGEDVSLLTDRLYNEAIVLREGNTPNALLEKAVANLELSKSLPVEILPYLKAKKIAVVMPGQPNPFA